VRVVTCVSRRVEPPVACATFTAVFFWRFRWLCIAINRWIIAVLSRRDWRRFCAPIGEHSGSAEVDRRVGWDIRVESDCFSRHSQLHRSSRIVRLFYFVSFRFVKCFSHAKIQRVPVKPEFLGPYVASRHDTQDIVVSWRDCRAYVQNCLLPVVVPFFHKLPIWFRLPSLWTASITFFGDDRRVMTLTYIARAKTIN